MSCVSDQTYTVKAGDTLFGIAQQQLGDGKRWREITKADGTPVTDADATTLQVGQELCIPDGSSSPGSDSSGSSSSPGGMAEEMLNAQNRYRAEMGVPPLQWSGDLAASAQQWVDHLAATGTFEHSGAGENLAQGTSGAYSVTKLVDLWGNEKQYFVQGTFPNVSNSGKWSDVGHYTQMIWRNTTQVGCGLASGNGNDVLVCHYNPAGNVTGQGVV